MVDTYVPSEMRVREWLPRVFGENTLSTAFFERQHVLAEDSDEEEGVSRNYTSKV